jgi:uncharacterized protein YjdB
VLILLVFALLLCGCSASDSKDSDVDYSEIDADLVTAPSVEYVIACLNNVDAITGIELDDLANSTASSSSGLDKATATIYFSCNLVEETDTSKSVKEQGTAGGGSIDIFSTVEDAEYRDEYLSGFDNGLLDSGYHTVVGTLVIRTSKHLDEEEQKTFEAEIVAALTSGEVNPNGAVVDTSVTATIPYAEVESISFGEENYTVGVGRTVDIPFSLYPENATSETLEVSIDNTEIASLSFENKEERIIQITGLLPGEVTITLTSGEAIVATKTVMIVEVMPDEMTIKADPKAPEIGSSGVLTVEFDPMDVTNQKVTWHSDAPNVLKVNEDGSFEAISIGEATITASHESGVTSTILVEVIPIQVDSVKLSTNWGADKPFCKGDSMTLTAEISPENATDKSITWTSSNESVVTVSDKGVVKAVAHGTAVITATASNGKTGTYQITVDPTPQKFTVSISIQMQSNDHVGNSWTKGAEFNDEAITSGSVVTIMPGETFSARGWAQDNDSKPDYGSYFERLTLTDEMCKSGFTIEGEAKVRENGGRYSGNYSVWYVKITFTPIN